MKDKCCVCLEEKDWIVHFGVCQHHACYDCFPRLLRTNKCPLCRCNLSTGAAQDLANNDEPIDTIILLLTRIMIALIIICIAILPAIFLLAIGTHQVPVIQDCHTMGPPGSTGPQGICLGVK